VIRNRIPKRSTLYHVHWPISHVLFCT